MTPEARAFVEGIDIGARRLDVEYACLMAMMMLEVVIIQHSTDRLRKRIDAVPICEPSCTAATGTW